MINIQKENLESFSMPIQYVNRPSLDLEDIVDQSAQDF